MTYSEKLKSPNWQKKRLEILNRDEFCCQSCYDDKSTLHVHHMHYFPNSEPWEIADNYLITLCEECHQSETENYKNAIDELVLHLKYGRFLTKNIKELTNIINSLDDEWARFDPNFDILKMAVSTPEIWKILRDIFFKKIDKK